MVDEYIICNDYFVSGTQDPFGVVIILKHPHLVRFIKQPCFLNYIPVDDGCKQRKSVNYFK